MRGGREGRKRWKGRVAKLQDPHSNDVQVVSRIHAHARAHPA